MNVNQKDHYNSLLTYPATETNMYVSVDTNHDDG